MSLHWQPAGSHFFAPVHPVPDLRGSMQTVQPWTERLPIVGLEIDWETRSAIDLTVVGAMTYSLHPSTTAVIAAYRIDGGPLRRWWSGMPCPDDIRAYVEKGGKIIAHNATFERLIWWNCMVRRGWPRPDLTQFVDTQTMARALVLPASLEDLGEALDLGVKKDKRGKELIKLLSIPMRFEKGEPIFNEDPVLYEEFMVYCERDVDTQSRAYMRMVPLSDSEMEVYALNEKINDRGIRVDTVSIQAAIRLAEKAKLLANDEVAMLTGGAATAVSQDARLKKWFLTQGLVMDDMQAATVEETLNEVQDLTPAAERVLELRQATQKSSITKLPKMMQLVSPYTGRVHGVYVHHGAGQTGRWSARDLQVHNLSKYRKVFEDAGVRLDCLYENIRTADPRVLEFFYGKELGAPIHLLSDSVRGFIWAAPGHEFLNIDYSSIEGVMGAWFAGEEWKLKAYHEINADPKNVPDLYKRFASKIYQVLCEEIDKKQRGVGKIGELSMGYQGGVAALAKMARQNKVKLAGLYEGLWASIEGKIHRYGKKEMDSREYHDKVFQNALNRKDRSAMRLGREAYIAANIIKIAWREMHPATVAAWDELHQAAFAAVESPGTVIPALGGKVAYLVREGFLWCRLPSGRAIAYAKPEIREVYATWDLGLPEDERGKILAVTVLGVDEKNNLSRRSIYGGAQFNNVVQGSAADVLRYGMLNAEKAGFNLVMHTHDELQAEHPIGEKSLEELTRVTGVLPPWLAGAPIVSAGWVGKRYRKD